jgi:hypothetical protein
VRDARANIGSYIRSGTEANAVDVVSFSGGAAQTARRHDGHVRVNSELPSRFGERPAGWNKWADFFDNRRMG